jgi:mRNA degradation ribonuclease J1/J2
VSRAVPLCWLIGLLLGSCAEPAPSETAVDLISDAGLLEAHVRFTGPVERGDNELLVELAPTSGAGEPRLLAVSAVMPAHAHETHAGRIERTASGFRASELNLFMTGRWQVELTLELAGSADSVSLPVDVP